MPRCQLFLLRQEVLTEIICSDVQFPAASSYQAWADSASVDMSYPISCLRVKAPICLGITLFSTHTSSHTDTLPSYLLHLEHSLTSVPPRTEQRVRLFVHPAVAPPGKSWPLIKHHFKFKEYLLHEILPFGDAPVEIQLGS